MFALGVPILLVTLVPLVCRQRLYFQRKGKLSIPQGARSGHSLAKCGVRIDKSCHRLPDRSHLGTLPRSQLAPREIELSPALSRISSRTFWPRVAARTRVP